MLNVPPKTDVHTSQASAIKNGAHKVKAELHEMAFEAGQRSREIIDSAEGELADIKKTAAAVIRKKPLQSGVLALGVGVLIGMLLRRR